MPSEPSTWAKERARVVLGNWRWNDSRQLQIAAAFDQARAETAEICEEIAAFGCSRSDGTYGEGRMAASEDIRAKFAKPEVG